MNNTEQTPHLEQLKTIEGTRVFFDAISEESRKNLMDVMQEKLELLKKHKIYFAQTTYRPPNDGYQTHRSDLDSRYLQIIFQKNNITTPLLPEELINKIDNQSLNRKEAKEVVVLLSTACGKGFDDVPNPCYWTTLEYGSQLSE